MIYLYQPTQSVSDMLFRSSLIVTYMVNLAACTETATGLAAERTAAPHVASAINADIASSAATLGKGRLFDVGGCSKGSSNKSK